MKYPLTVDARPSADSMSAGDNLRSPSEIFTLVGDMDFEDGVVCPEMAEASRRLDKIVVFVNRRARLD